MRQIVKILALSSLMLTFCIAVFGQDILALTTENSIPFDSSQDINFNTLVRPVSESELQLEDWMLKPVCSKDISLSEVIRVEIEPPIKLEDWMLCCADW